MAFFDPYNSMIGLGMGMGGMGMGMGYGGYGGYGGMGGGMMSMMPGMSVSEISDYRYVLKFENLGIGRYGTWWMDSMGCEVREIDRVDEHEVLVM